MSVLFFLAAQGEAVETSPQMQSVSVSRLVNGACAGLGVNPQASINIAWSALQFDADLHTFKVYENDVLVATQSTSPYVKTVVGKMENGLTKRFTSNWVFRVDVTEIDGTVLSSLSSAEWAVVYGSCTGLDEPT